MFVLAIPIIDIYLLLKIGGVIGVLPTVILVVATAMLGTMMLRNQGLSTLKRLQDTLARRELPAQEIVEGPLVVIGGALLLSPGFITDVMGLYLLIPFTRKRFVKYLLGHSLNRSDAQVRSNVRHPNDRLGTTIEGDFKREE
ncbi:MAG: FxsA family protein [Methylococcaceae bacterium]|nr:FxsA family protein [Methylococcaceae bacterium]